MFAYIAFFLFSLLTSEVTAAPHVVESLQPPTKWFNSFWTDTASSVKYKNLPGGAYSVTWNGTGNFVGGKGWNPGSTSMYASSRSNLLRVSRYNITTDLLQDRELDWFLRAQRLRLPYGVRLDYQAADRILHC